MSPSYLCYTELTHQSEAWSQAVDAVLSAAEEFKHMVQAYQPDQVIFLACGSPYYLGQSAAVYWQRVLKIPVRSIMASEIVLYPDGYLPPAGQKPLLVIVSRSGSTSEVIWALEQFNARFPDAAVLVTCSPESVLSESLTHKILIPSAMEVTVPQTRSFSAMYLAVQLLGSVLAGDQALTDLLTDAPKHVDPLIQMWEPRIERLITENDIHNLFYLGSGPIYGIAKEAALKMAEMSLTEAFAYPFLESRHGPRSLIDHNTLVVGLFSKTGFDYEQTVMEELLRDSHAHTLAITPEQYGTVRGAAVQFSLDIAWPDDIQGLAYLPLVQLMAYYRAIAQGVNPDESRNLVPFVKLNKGGSPAP